MKSGGLFLGGALVLIIMFLLFQNYNHQSHSPTIIIPEIIGGDPSTWTPTEQHHHHHGGHVTPKLIGGDPATWGPPPQVIGGNPATWGPSPIAIDQLHKSGEGGDLHP